jgi:Domain of unknown function (DUF4861)
MKLNALLRAAALAAVSTSSPAQTVPAASPAVVELAEVLVRNDAAFARRETIEVSLRSLPGVGKPADLRRVRVVDEATGKEILAQAMDTDGDYDEDTLVFQADLVSKAAARFRLTLGETRTYRREDFRVYGRFNRERFDDFVWENDKVAFRMYGEALETWVREPLTSSSVDAWVKKTNRLVANDWYLVDNYHKDHGEGGDFYSAGKTRGCGGSGLIAEGRLFTSKNFRRSRVLSRGPIRLLFELEYDAWDVAGVKVRERKRVTLDAGSNFKHVHHGRRGSPPSRVDLHGGDQEGEGRRPARRSGGRRGARLGRADSLRQRWVDGLRGDRRTRPAGFESRTRRKRAGRLPRARALLRGHRLGPQRRFQDHGRLRRARERIRIPSRVADFGSGRPAVDGVPQSPEGSAP